MTQYTDLCTDNSSLHGSTVDGTGRSGRQRSPIERWEESLLSSTSLSQIYVHLSALDMSVVWSRSSLHARCRICRRKGDGEHMLLCDACDRGHHMYCLKPPVKVRNYFWLYVLQRLTFDFSVTVMCVCGGIIMYHSRSI